MTKEEIELKRKEYQNLKRMVKCAYLGGIAILYASLNKVQKAPFKQNMFKYYVPAIETIDEDYNRTNPVLMPSKKNINENNIELLIEYNSGWQLTNNGLYQKNHCIYSYKNIKEEDIKDIVDNIDLLDEYLDKKAEFPEYTKTIDINNNYPTYNIQILNKEKSIYYYELQSKTDALSNTFLFLILAGLLTINTKAFIDNKNHILSKTLK